MKTQRTLAKLSKLSAIAACAAFVAIAGAAVTTHAASPDRAKPVAAEPVVRLDPVTVTMTRARFDALRDEAGHDTAVARDDEIGTVAHG